MTNNLILPKISPIHIIGFGALLGILLITALTYFALQQPWLGIQLSPQPGSQVLLVHSVLKDSPAENKLKAGDTIIGFQHNNQFIPVDALHNIEEPAILASYEEHNAFIDAQETLAQLLKNNTITIQLQDKSIELKPAQQRPLSSLPFVNYWLIILCGFSSFIIGLNVWSFRRGQDVSRILAIAGSGLFFGSVFNAVTLSRELALPGEIYFNLSSAAHFGVMLFAFSAVATIWNYPRRVSDFPATTMIYLFFLLLWINQTWQIISMPFHVYYFHFLVDFMLLAAFAIRQWNQARDSAIDQAALQWLLFTLVVSLGITIAFFYIPTIYAAEALISIGATYFCALLVFLGLTMGIIKYRLFNLSSIWMEAWVWLIGGSILLLVDLALVYLLDLASGFALALSAVIVGWVYFPARQWISVNLLKLQPRSIEHYFPVLIEKLIAIESSKSLIEKWQDILQDIFSPLEISREEVPCEKIKITENGTNMLVPSLDNQATLVLNYRDHGKKLYTQNDVALCKGILELTRYTANIKVAHEEGAQNERKRIARDLHDDIAAQLLTLIHGSNDLQITDKAKQILKTLRETIYSLDVKAEVDIRTVLDQLYEIIHERTELANITLDWQVDRFNNNLSIRPRQHINLKRSIQEVLSNIIKHANASQVSVFIKINHNNLQVQICDDGIGGNIDHWVAGKGLNNIRTRISEIDGAVSWHHNAKSGINNAQQGCCVNLQFPL